MDEFILIGKIVQTHGIKGELRIRSNFQFKDRVFKKNFNLYIGESHFKQTINSYRPHKGFDMVTFVGFDNINQVLNYLKMNVYVKKDDIKLASDEYILEELIDYSVMEDGKILGKVKDIVYNGSNILLYIAATKNFYIPNNAHFIKKVNRQNKYIEVANTKGLII